MCLMATKSGDPAYIFWIRVGMQVAFHVYF